MSPLLNNKGFSSFQIMLLVLACIVILVVVTLLRFSLVSNYRAVKNENISTTNEIPPPPPTVDELLNNTTNIEPGLRE